MIAAKVYAAQQLHDKLTPWNFERREVGHYDVKIEILYCGVCHTDIHNLKNEWFLGIFPMVSGHEIVRKIVKLGDHAKKFDIGDLAGIGTYVDSCRKCQDCNTVHEVFAQKEYKLTTI